LLIAPHMSAFGAKADMKLMQELNASHSNWYDH
jgi:hypothetical protein